VVTTFAGAAGQAGSIDGIGTAARFDSPSGLASDGAGNLFVIDSGNYTIRKIVIATAVVTTLAGSAGQAGSADGVGADARFGFPWGGFGCGPPSGVASDGAGNLFVADLYNKTIRKIVTATGVVTTLAGSAGVSGSSDGTGSAAQFSCPTGLAADGAGNLFVADSGDFTIRQIAIATGVVTTLAGSAGEAGSVDGVGAAARFGGVHVVTIDDAGNLFVAESTTDRYDNYRRSAIRKVVISTAVVTTVIGSPDDGTGIVLGPLPAELAHAQGLTFVPPAQLFITDTDENAILVAKF